MGRFNSLELDVPSPPEQVEQARGKLPGEAIRDAEFYLREARAFYRSRDLEPALRSYSKALEIDPGSAEAWNGQINCLIQLNELYEAEMWSKKAVEIVGESQELLALQARVFCRRGDFDRAFGLSDSALQSPGNSPLIWVVRGEIMLYSRNKQPEFCFDKAVTAARQDYQTFMDIAECCMYAGKYALAFKYLKSAMDINPGIAPLWMMLAECYRMLGNRKKAVECLNKVMEVDPDYDTTELIREVRAESGIRSFFRRLFRF
jgi:tetratricopeptide (TPR) repeat protein